MFLIVKIAVSAVVIGIITEIARRSPETGGIVAALPLVSLLSLFWLSVQGESLKHLSQFAAGVLWGLPATAALILIVAVCLKSSLPLAVSFVFGLCGWGGCLFLQKAIFG
ncbi:membrane protein [Bacillus glycinifermentans]|uniref:DUF3147 family protein n=1 Tax=Bacillus glycinifermentans TaxID=1664069 RepID=A0A0J6EB59_9BACI|nr:DUF3147 family protein [Bacillus glycinifermentans]ATH94300.1 hypothetical protein COP00_18160 [Bacillus glycinifermentans]KMM63040.1 membrane protein [Bacillus glycinifermentans]KRT95720.1 hypothetical protein AB447_201040 [Bacillus glycinifermentans]MEC0484387.1 DUF3147 family protein [Bacillus glycinifermentans]MEC0496779.1 DUF3147 family protein [Bacillus glycinifermentans]